MQPPLASPTYAALPVPTNFTSQSVDIDPDNFPDFLEPDVTTTDDAPTGTNIFNSPAADVDAMLSIDTPPVVAVVQTAEERAADAAAKAVLTDLDNDLADEDAQVVDAASKAGRPKTDKSALVTTIKELIDDDTLFGYDDDKPLEDYTQKELAELIKLNIQTKLDDVKAATPKEFFDSLPEELQYAAKYVDNGGTDIRSLFRVLGEVEENKALDIAKPADQAQIMRTFLQAKQFGSAADIEEEIADATAAGTLAKKAAKYKPELDGMQQEQVEAKLAQAKLATEQNAKAKETYLKDIHTTLVTGELGGTKIDKKRQEALWNNLTQNTYQTRRGQPTNKLGHMLENVQFGETKNMGLLAEVTWLLEDREGYLKHMSQKAVNETVIDTSKKLKTAQSQKVASTTTASDESEATPKKRTLAKPTNMFGR